MSLTITNVDLGAVDLDALYDDDILASAGADELAAGTILARTTATGKLGLFDPAGAGGLEIACCVLANALSIAGAGDVAVRPIIGGTVNADRLVIDDGTTITKAHLDQLRARSIVPLTVTEQSTLDNQ